MTCQGARDATGASPAFAKWLRNIGQTLRLQVDRGAVAAVHVERHRFVLMRDLPCPTDVAETKGQAKPDVILLAVGLRSAQSVEAVAERRVSAREDGEVADLVAEPASPCGEPRPQALRIGSGRYQWRREVGSRCPPHSGPSRPGRPCRGSPSPSVDQGADLGFGRRVPEREGALRMPMSLSSTFSLPVRWRQISRPVSEGRDARRRDPTRGRPVHRMVARLARPSRPAAIRDCREPPLLR